MEKVKNSETVRKNLFSLAFVAAFDQLAQHVKKNEIGILTSGNRGYHRTSFALDFHKRFGWYDEVDANKLKNQVKVTGENAAKIVVDSSTEGLTAISLEHLDKLLEFLYEKKPEYFSVFLEAATSKQLQWFRYKKPYEAFSHEFSEYVSNFKKEKESAPEYEKIMGDMFYNVEKAMEALGQAKSDRALLEAKKSTITEQNNIINELREEKAEFQQVLKWLYDKVVEIQNKKERSEKDLKILELRNYIENIGI